MIKLVVYLAENCLEHIQTQCEKQFHFQQTTTNNQNISGDSAIDKNNKIEK